MSSFRVGQKVVWIGEIGDILFPGCFLDDPISDDLELGKIYVVTNSYVDEHGFAMIELEGMYSPRTDEFSAGYAAVEFRPVVERKTDISIFTAMLDDAKSPVPA